MKIYLAARYGRRKELQGYAKQLRACGLTVNARWLQGEHQVGGEDQEPPPLSAPMSMQPFALQDREDVFNSDAVISFTEAPRQEGASRGGRHVEFGLAEAWGKLLLVVGPRENVFHTLPSVVQFWNWSDEVIETLRSYAQLNELGLTSPHAFNA